MNLERHLPAMLASAIAFTLLVHALPATAQPTNGATRIGGFVSGAVGSGQSTATVGLFGMYRFTPRFGVEGDLMHLSDLTVAEFQVCSFSDPSCGVGSFHARVSSFTANFVAEMPIGSDRVRPYLAVGGGAARIRREARDFSALTCNPCRSEAEMSPVVSAGGGVDFLVWRGFGVGLDVRYQRLFEDERNFKPAIKHLTRVGSFVSVRF